MPPLWIAERRHGRRTPRSALRVDSVGRLSAPCLERLQQFRIHSVDFPEQREVDMVRVLFHRAAHLFRRDRVELRQHGLECSTC